MTARGGSRVGSGVGWSDLTRRIVAAGEVLTGEPYGLAVLAPAVRRVLDPPVAVA